MTTSLNLNKKQAMSIQRGLGIVQRFEQMVLAAVAAIGIVGSIYIFIANANGPDGNNFNQFSTAAVVGSTLDAEVDEGSFKDFVSLKGKKKAGQEISFTTKMDIKEKRYVMEMGDGMRMIITQPNFTYQYDEKGTYLLELKTIERGLITTVATKKLKIK